MMNVSLGPAGGGRMARWRFALSQRLRSLAAFRMTVIGADGTYEFMPEYGSEFSRYLSYFTKEEGTLAWLKSSLRPGDVFFDVGANIGLYSIYAAKLGRNVRVFAFEPHKFNFVKLVQNVSTNNLLDVIAPLAIPLGAAEGMTHLRYCELATGSSNTQLKSHHDPEPTAFHPQFEEIVISSTIDRLVESASLPAPQLVKIDVDGIEAAILEGMSDCLRSATGPRSVQVEANKGQKKMLIEFMAAHDYVVDHSHFTAGGKKRLAQGRSEDEIAHNLVFRRKPLPGMPT